MSDSTRKGDLSKCFSAFGEVMDVFMGRKKDKAGRNFAFVKFYGVEDVYQKESDMQGMVCASKSLVVNLAKYDRNKKPAAHGQSVKSPHAPPQYQSAAVHNSNSRTSDAKAYGTKSYADVTCGKKGIAAPMPPSSHLLTPVTISASGTSKNWINENVLIGEVMSLDHMAALPEVFISGDGIIEQIKYVGGMHIALCFKSQSFAVEFMEDSGRWMEWLLWIKPGEEVDLRRDRIAWIKIIGLPMVYWDDNCMETILKNYGKVIVPSDEMKAGTDASIITVGILTHRRSWINDDVAVIADGDGFNIGLVEFDHTWTPFPDPPSCDNGESGNSDEDGEDDDGVSDTAMVESEEEVSEDGEIPAAENPTVSGNESGKVPQMVDLEEEDAEAGEITATENPSVSGSDSGNVQDFVEVPLTRDNEERFNAHADGHFISNNVHFISNNTAASISDKESGPQEEYVHVNHHFGLNFPVSYFGPFVASFPDQTIDNGPCAGEPIVESNSLILNRRIRRAERRFSPYDLHRLPRSKSSAPGAPDIVPLDSPGIRNICNSPPFDLNRSLSVSSADLPASEDEDAGLPAQEIEDDCISSSIEIGKIVKIGTEVGFNIKLGDPMLAQLNGEHGESIGHP